MNEDQFASLAKIREETDRALDLAMEQGVDGSINWADLSCTSARYWIDEQGQSGYSVHIEEASPSNSKLKEFVIHHLRQAGFREQIDVVTEW